jgi:hypothetical protein
MNCDVLNALSAASTVIASIVVVVAAVLAFFELKHMARDATVSALSIVLNELGIQEVSRARHSLLTYPLPKVETLSDDKADYWRLHAVWTSFDKVGAMVHFELIPRDIILELYCESIIRCWHRLKPYIERERERLGHDQYQKYFEELYHTAVEYKGETYGREDLALGDHRGGFE